MWETKTGRLGPSKEKENFDGEGWRRGRRSETERQEGGRERGKERERESENQVTKLKHPFPLSLFVRRTKARGESVRDRKLVKSGGQRVELSVALSVAGFIRSEGGIYVGPSVIYRFRWHTRYRYTDIDTSLVRARQSRPPAFFLSLSFFPLLPLCIYAALLGPFSLSLFIFQARLDLPGDTCGADPVNTTSSIVKAKRLGLPSGSSTAGISFAEAAKENRNSYKNIMYT